jgi:hypothetical protein
VIEPDFGELQFQQLFNNELVHKLPFSGIQPIIPTQPEEKDLGWDTGFNIPGFEPPDPSQKNCNLFLQYKLAKIKLKQMVSGVVSHYHTGEMKSFKC